MEMEEESSDLRDTFFLDKLGDNIKHLLRPIADEMRNLSSISIGQQH